jgi:hypothetical protein
MLGVSALSTLLVTLAMSQEAADVRSWECCKIRDAAQHSIAWHAAHYLGCTFLVWLLSIPLANHRFVSLEVGGCGPHVVGQASSCYSEPRVWGARTLLHSCFCTLCSSKCMAIISLCSQQQLAAGSLYSLFIDACLF